MTAIIRNIIYLPFSMGGCKNREVQAKTIQVMNLFQEWSNLQLTLDASGSLRNR